MKSKILFACTLCVVILLAGCSHNRDKQIAAITKMEQSLSAIAVNPQTADSIVTLYVQFADRFSKDSLAPVYLQRAADVSVNVGNTDEALEYIDRIIGEYPDFSDIAGCYFLKGFAYEQSEQYDLAKEAYTFFVENYPEHNLAADTKKMIPYIGMSPEQMLDMLLANSNAGGIFTEEE